MAAQEAGRRMTIARKIPAIAKLWVHEGLRRSGINDIIINNYINYKIIFF
jgi:hypothetical protein